MSTISLILKPHPDGSLHVPLPPDMRSGTFRVQVTPEPVDDMPPPRAGLWKDLPGEWWISPDFDEPLEDFKDYMP